MKYKVQGGQIIIPQKMVIHLKAHPEIMGILPEVMDNLILPKDGSFLRREVEMGRLVGLSGCVETLPIQKFDETFFAQRTERKKPSRIVIGDLGEETSKVSILAFPDRSGSGDYILITTWIGFLAPKEPWDNNIKSEKEFQESLDFWLTHALIYQEEVMGQPFTSSWERILK